LGYTIQEENQRENMNLNNDLQNYCFLLTAKGEESNTAADSGKEKRGMAVVDFQGNFIEGLNSFTDVPIAIEKGCICSVLRSDLSYSGEQASEFNGGDYVAVASLGKPQVSYFQWGNKKSSVSHLQETVSCMTTDQSGRYMFVGTQRGMVYVWEVLTGELLFVNQFHFQKITKLVVTANSQYLVSVGDDGSCKVWQLYQMLDIGSSSNSSINPFR
jgi:WD40 repeat protein